ncbi:MAG: hypothetical protein HPY66_2976 [Firmicutes bacterium]|nr:hypothetical protein [Bacillota bacterium]
MSKQFIGTVEFYDDKKGYGRIKKDGEDSKIHMGTDSFSGSAPRKGDRVIFRVVQDRRGPHAVDVKIEEDEIVTYFKENVLRLKEIDYDEFCDNARKYAEKLRYGKVTTSMIRKVYSRVMNAKNAKELKMLRPQFAYTAGRNEKKLELKEFMDILDHLVREMVPESEDQMDNFKKFMEAIVAYRKFVGNDE